MHKAHARPSDSLINLACYPRWGSVCVLHVPCKAVWGSYTAFEAMYVFYICFVRLCKYVIQPLKAWMLLAFEAVYVFYICFVWLCRGLTQPLKAWMLPVFEAMCALNMCFVWLCRVLHSLWKRECCPPLRLCMCLHVLCQAVYGSYTAFESVNVARLWGCVCVLQVRCKAVYGSYTAFERVNVARLCQAVLTNKETGFRTDKGILE